MTGKQAITQAVSLLGRNEQRGAFPDAFLLSNAMTALNCIYADLFCLCTSADFEPLWTLDDEISLPDSVLYDCFLYGVAYMLAQADDDFETVNRFCEIYNKKRAKCQKISKISDTVFKGCEPDVL